MERDSDQPSFSPARRLSTAVNVALSVAGLLAIVLVANYLAQRH